MIEAFDTRTALLPLHFESRKVSIDGEFIVDYHYGRFFINKNGIIEEICRDELLKIANNTINDVLGVNYESVNFNLLISNINSIRDWIDSHTIPTDNRINTFKQLSHFLSGMENFDFTINEILENKVDMIYGKTLSDNNLSDDDVKKIKSIGYGAKTYIHPKDHLCDINKGVYKLNGYPEKDKFGDIILSTHDIGLGNIDPEANYYEHPETKQCNAFMIESLNGMSGDVKFTKSNIGLPNMKNMPLASQKDYYSDNSYASPAIIENYLSEIENSKNIKCTDSYISDKIVVTIKNTSDGQINSIKYNDSGSIINISLNILIDDLYALDGGDKLIILSNNKLLLYEYKDGSYSESNFFSDYSEFDIDIINNNIVKSIIEPREGVYGVILTNSNNKDFIYTWGKINEKTDPYKHGVEKVEIVGEIMYILFDNGRVEYKEYLDGMIDDRYREVILTYNDIIDIFVRKDYLICIRGNRSIVVAGDDTEYNKGIPSKIKNNTFNPYRIYVQDDIVCILSTDGSMTMIGRNIDKLPSKFQYPIDKVTIYKNKVIFIDEEDNMISVL